MKCPKCGYHSFDYLENCKKCDQSLSDHKGKFNLRGFFSPEQPEDAPGTAAVAEEAPASEAGDVDFGFDFLDEEEPAQPAPSATPDIDLGTEEDLNLSQPYGIDSETLPADDTADGKKKKSAEDNFEF